MWMNTIRSCCCWTNSLSITLHHRGTSSDLMDREVGRSNSTKASSEDWTQLFHLEKPFRSLLDITDAIEAMLTAWGTANVVFKQTVTSLAGCHTWAMAIDTVPVVPHRMLIGWTTVRWILARWIYKILQE